MANPEWLEIFRSYSPEKLAQRITELEQEVSVYAQQAVGSKSYVKDLAELRGQFAAAVRVQKERATRTNPAVGVTDFSGINSGGGRCG
jgi:hypothetical protein